MLYVIGGIGYVIYSVYKAAKNKAEENPSVSPKPNTQPKANPFEEIAKELKRKQAEADARRWQVEQQAKANKPAPMREISNEAQRAQNDIESKKRRDQQQGELVTKKRPFDGKVKKAPDVLVHEKKSSLFQEGVSNFESTYEREQTAEDKIVRGDLKVSNEGVYRIESIEEAEAREAASQIGTSFTFDARNAVISSIILERKF